ncbi:MAG TPA: phosphate signaling complex protein PhoU [Actinomycetota bacterium]|jgi:phosphate transport system protein|nr:phosphate signaling complex protein PhoU [Actinomycetota bacterium]
MGRPHFHEELERIELEILAMGELAERSVSRGVDALARRDAQLAHAVVDADDEIDERYLDVEERILRILALQTPVASDLRLLSAMLHINLHLERIGDQAVNIAKIFLSVEHLAGNQVVVGKIREMGDIVGPMIREAMTAFRTRDLELCLRLPQMDDPVDRLNLGMYQEIAALADDAEMLDWGLRMLVVARQLERVGDNAVDVAEQVGFLLTGEFREFTDASHPVHIDLE